MSSRETSIGTVPNQRGLAWKAYTMVWLVLAGLSASYLTSAVAWSKLAEQIGNSTGTVQSEVASANEKAAKYEAAARTLKSKYSRLRRSKNRLSKQLKAAKAKAADLQTRIANLEIAVREATEVASVAPPKTDREATAQPAQEIAAKPKPATVVASVSAPPLPPRAPRSPVQVAAASPAVVNGATIINRQKSSAVTTGSIPKTAAPRKPAAPAITFGAAEVKVAAQTSGVALSLSSGPSVDALRLSWRVLKDNHGSVLQGLKPRYIATPNATTGTSYRLIAGPVQSRNEADQLCTILKAQGRPCGISPFAGNAL